MLDRLADAQAVDRIWLALYGDATPEMIGRRNGGRHALLERILLGDTLIATARRRRHLHRLQAALRGGRA